MSGQDSYGGARVDEMLPPELVAELVEKTLVPNSPRRRRPSASADVTELLSRIEAATWTVAELIEHVPHDQGCPQRFEQTSEFACTCSRRATYRDLQATLRDAHAALTNRPTDQT